MRAITASQTEGNDVALDARKSGDEGLCANAHMLMHGGCAANHRMIANFDMAAEQHLIGQHDAIAKTTIMRDMRRREKDAARANLRACAGAGVNRDAFAHDAVGAERDGALSERVFEILRRRANR